MEIQERIESKITQGDFLANMLRVARSEGPRLQHAFVEHVGNLAEKLSAFLRANDRIRKAKYDPAAFWPRQKGRAFGFVDGGVAAIDLLGASPLGVRVGSYVVRPGDESDKREEFKIEFSIVDDLYAEQPSTFDVPEDLDDRYDDRAKLRDAARIISEIAAALALSRRRQDLGVLLVHGPLINPAAPYGPPGFPHFTAEASEGLFGTTVASDDRHFVPLYRRILEQLKAAAAPVFGVVERDGGGRPLLERLILSMHQSGDLPEAEKKAGLALLRKYDLSDAQILDVVLDAGEYLAPTTVMRQEPSNKWPKDWEENLKLYPNPLTTFLKPSETVRPFRIETFEGTQNYEEAVVLILATARLLPGYGFPVALDIVDKFAKVRDGSARRSARDTRPSCFARLSNPTIGSCRNTRSRCSPSAAGTGSSGLRPNRDKMKMTWITNTENMIGTVVGNTSTDSYRFILRSFRAKVGDIVATLSAIPDDKKSHGNAIIWGRIVSIDRHNPFFPAEAAQELAEQNIRLIDTVLSTSRDYLNAEVLILGSSDEDSGSQMDLSPLTYPVQPAARVINPPASAIRKLLGASEEDVPKLHVGTLLGRSVSIGFQI